MFCTQVLTSWILMLYDLEGLSLVVLLKIWILMTLYRIIN